MSQEILKKKGNSWKQSDFKAYRFIWNDLRGCYCSGWKLFTAIFDRREPGMRHSVLQDYFPEIFYCDDGEGTYYPGNSGDVGDGPERNLVDFRIDSIGLWISAFEILKS